MVDINVNKYFKTFFLSHETSSCPFIPQVVSFVKKTESLLEHENLEIIVSSRYGKRVLTNLKFNNFKLITPDDFIEMVDYNPITRILMVIGDQTPGYDAPLHWMILHAKKEISIVVKIKTDEINEKFLRDTPMVETKNNEDILELTKKILFKLRNTSNLLIKNMGILLTGKTINEVEKTIMDYFLNKNIT